MALTTASRSADERVLRLLLALPFAVLEPAGHRHMAFEEQRRLFQNLERVTEDLPLVDELVLGRPSESRHAQGALRVVRHLLAPKQDDSRPQQSAFAPQLKPIQRIGGRRERCVQSFHVHGHAMRPLNLGQVQVLKGIAVRELVLPAVQFVRSHQQPLVVLRLWHQGCGRPNPLVRPGRRTCTVHRPTEPPSSMSTSLSSPTRMRVCSIQAVGSILRIALATSCNVLSDTSWPPILPVRSSRRTVLCRPGHSGTRNIVPIPAWSSPVDFLNSRRSDSP